jgi:hypothetical protein
MRVENTKIKLTIPIPINKPDCNGVVYTEKAVENAVNNLNRHLPIIYQKSNDDQPVVIGATTSGAHIVTWDFDNQVCNLTVDGMVFHSGAEIFINEIEDGKVTDFRIAGIGLTT